MQELHQIREDVHSRTAAIAAAHGNWPCRKGCDDCCRNLASPPRVSREEWLPIEAAIDRLPPDVAAVARRRIREGVGTPRPVICPLLDRDSGSCLVYEVRPVACRAYGFYADRREVLGCSRIESVASQSPDIIWGNHAALEARLQNLGESLELSAWMSR